VTVYHVVIEGTLGLAAFNFITRYLESSGQLPGFVEGYSKIHHDEQPAVAHALTRRTARAPTGRRSAPARTRSASSR
jgi:hypothetical protein